MSSPNHDLFGFSQLAPESLKQHQQQQHPTISSSPPSVVVEQQQEQQSVPFLYAIEAVDQELRFMQRLEEQIKQQQMMNATQQNQRNGEGQEEDKMCAGDLDPRLSFISQLTKHKKTAGETDINPIVINEEDEQTTTGEPPEPEEENDQTEDEEEESESSSDEEYETVAERIASTSTTSSTTRTTPYKMRMLPRSPVADWKQEIDREKEKKREEELTRTLEALTLFRAKDDAASRELVAKVSQTIQKTALEAEERLKLRSKAIRALVPQEEFVLEKLVSVSKHTLETTLGEKLELERQHVKHLNNGQWLDDELVNWYMALLQIRESKVSSDPKCLFFNSFFYIKLSSRTYNYRSVKKWAPGDVLGGEQYDILFIPINRMSHWTLVAVYPKQHHVVYYDSLYGSGSEVLMSITKWIADEWKDKHPDTPNPTWTTEAPRAIPRQLNGYDCGVFMCRYAECLSRNGLLNFEQKDMTMGRKLMLYEILSKTLIHQKH